MLVQFEHRNFSRVFVVVAEALAESAMPRDPRQRPQD
jgi:hypothetical protein